MFGPVVVLDGDGFRDETNCVQRLLQRVSRTCRAERRNSGRSVGIQRCESQILSLAATLSWALSNTDGGMSTKAMIMVRLAASVKIANSWPRIQRPTPGKRPIRIQVSARISRSVSRV